MNRSIRFLALFALLWTGFAGSLHANDDDTRGIKDTIKRSFKVSADGTLYIDLDYGDIEVSQISGDDVLVELERDVDTRDQDEAMRMLERHDYEIYQRRNDVTVRSRYERRNSRWGRNNNEVSFRIRVRIPEQYNVNFLNGAGNVEVEDVEGDVEGRTGAGNIVIGNIAGTVSIATGAGNVEVDGAVGRMDVSSGAGNVELRDVRGEVDATTGAGNVRAEIIRQPEGNSRLESGAGNVTVFLADDIQIDVDAQASLGSASNEFSLRVEGKWMTKSFAGELNGGGPRLRLRSGVGNVSLQRY